MNTAQRKSKARHQYDQTDLLHLDNQRYRKQIRRYVIDTIKDDANNDITTKKFLPRRQKASARIIAKEAGVLAGMEEFVWVCSKFSLRVDKPKADGSVLRAGSTIASISGNARIIFAVERTLLNMLQRMSGIATTTASYKKTIGPYPLIAATRKTAWGLLDKKAVALGGGYTHRLSLSDAVMVKDNHLLSLKQFEDIRHIYFRRKLFKEIEIDTPEQLKQIVRLQLPYDAILFDNFAPDQIKRALRWLEKNRMRNRYICEASGGITSSNLTQYANTGVDVLSLGSVTHSAQALDISLEINL